MFQQLNGVGNGICRKSRGFAFETDAIGLF
jgi:hypothetical protein